MSREEKEGERRGGGEGGRRGRREKRGGRGEREGGEGRRRKSRGRGGQEGGGGRRGRRWKKEREGREQGREEGNCEVALLPDFEGGGQGDFGTCSVKLIRYCETSTKPKPLSTEAIR